MPILDDDFPRTQEEKEEFVRQLHAEQDQRDRRTALTVIIDSLFLLYVRKGIRLDEAADKAFAEGPKYLKRRERFLAEYKE